MEESHQEWLQLRQVKTPPRSVIPNLAGTLEPPGDLELSKAWLYPSPINHSLGMWDSGTGIV